MISKTNIFLMDITSKSYHVYDANDEHKKEYYIPKSCMDGFDFDPDYRDENSDLKTKGEFYLRSQSINNHLKGDAVVKLIATRNNTEPTTPIM